MATTPLTASRYPISSDSPNIAQYFLNLAIDLEDNTIPRFTTTTARDNAYSAYVTAGGVMADGMQCVVNGVKYRRINGTWRVDRNRLPIRTVAVPGGSQSIISGGSSETGVTSGIAGLSSFTLYEASRVAIAGAFRAGGGAGVGQCYVKINGSTATNIGISRADATIPVIGAVDLASGTHSISARVDALGGSTTWVDAAIQISVGIAE